MEFNTLIEFDFVPCISHEPMNERIDNILFYDDGYLQEGSAYMHPHTLHKHTTTTRTAEREGNRDKWKKPPAETKLDHTKQPDLLIEFAVLSWIVQQNACTWKE